MEVFFLCPTNNTAHRRHVPSNIFRAARGWRRDTDKQKDHTHSDRSDRASVYAQHVTCRFLFCGVVQARLALPRDRPVGLLGLPAQQAGTTPPCNTTTYYIHGAFWSALVSDMSGRTASSVPNKKHFVRKYFGKQRGSAPGGNAPTTPTYHNENNSI